MQLLLESSHVQELHNHVESSCNLFGTPMRNKLFVNYWFLSFVFNPWDLILPKV